MHTAPTTRTTCNDFFYILHCLSVASEIYTKDHKTYIFIMMLTAFRDDKYSSAVEMESVSMQASRAAERQHSQMAKDVGKWSQRPHGQEVHSKAVSCQRILTQHPRCPSQNHVNTLTLNPECKT